jgi:hypothetical protein
MYKYSELTDLIYPCELLHLYNDLPADLVDISITEANDHMCNTPRGGMVRVRNKYPFEWVEHEYTIDDLIQIEIQWRNAELKSTDEYGLDDYPDNALRASMREYRQLLRDYPSVDGFGDSSLRPTRS